MKKYLSFFRLRFICGLQYRGAALAGIATQFFWGGMEIMIFKAFFEAAPQSFPMSFEATVSYVWLQQSFLALFAAWMMEGEIFDAIMNGNIAYELCRPINIYNMWFSRSVANRLSKAVLRCFPIFIFAAILPAPYRLCKPDSFRHFCLFLLTLALGLLVTVAFCVLIYVLTFFTVSPMGLRMVFVSMVEFFAGGVIPLPFFPEKLGQFMELLPFASMQNVPLRIYSGDIDGAEILKVVLLQLLWLVILTVTGKALCRRAEKKICIQGG